MSKVVRFHETGGPEVLRIEDEEVGEPGADELRLRIEAIGLNRAEVMFRSGIYLEQPQFPAQLGYEAAGTVEAVGAGVKDFKAGDAVSVIPAFSMNTYGTYAERALLPAHAVVKRPAGVDAETAAAVWMQYITAWGALIDIGQLRADEAVLIPAASSSVGLAAIQIANSVGAIPIAMTRTDDKVEALKNAGAADVVVSQSQDIAKAARQVTADRGVRMVFDPVAGPMVNELAETLSQNGTLFLYGNLSGAETPFPFVAALSKGLTVRGYTLFEITGDPVRLARAVKFINHGLEHDQLKPIIAKRFALDDIVEAHRYMESNRQFGKIIVEAAGN